MPSRKPKFVISLQPTQGLSKPIVFTVTGSKAEKILDLLRFEMEKHKQRTKPVSATLEPFFKEQDCSQ